MPSISRSSDFSQFGSAFSTASFSGTLTFLFTGLDASMPMGSLTSRAEDFAILSVFAVRSFTRSLEMRFVALNPNAPPTITLMAIPKLSSMIAGWGSPFFRRKPVPVPPCIRASA